MAETIGTQRRLSRLLTGRAWIPATPFIKFRCLLPAIVLTTLLLTLDRFIVRLFPTRNKPIRSPPIPFVNITRMTLMALPLAICRLLINIDLPFSPPTALSTLGLLLRISIIPMLTSYSRVTLLTIRRPSLLPTTVPLLHPIIMIPLAHRPTQGRVRARILVCRVPEKPTLTAKIFYASPHTAQNL